MKRGMGGRSGPWRPTLLLLVAAGFGGAVCTHPPGTALAQTAAPAPQPAAQPTQAGQNDRLDQGQLEALLAPIALYPDSLLMQVLMASTYPLEVVQAQRWVGQGNNAQLKGEDLAKALEAQSWDPSVKSLVPFPDVLTMMSDQLDWTQQVGDALLGQQEDVLNAVQVLRGRAHAAGTLQSGPQQTVNVTTNVVAAPAPGAVAPVVAPPPQMIVIEPTQPETVYVPAYNPNVVYGTWPYASYPPTYYPPPPSWGIGNALLTGMAFAGGVALVGSLWGWASPGWGRGNVNVNVNRYNNINVNRAQINNNVWRHDETHRHGVAYRNDQVRNTYRPSGTPQRADAREQFRGRTEQIQREGGLDRAQIGERDRPAAGDRPGVGDRERPGGGDRPNLGDRGQAQRPGGAGDRQNLADRRDGAGPAQRPAERPAQRPAERPAERPAQRPAERPAAADRQPARTASGRPQVQPAAPQRADRGALQGAANPQRDAAAASRGQASRQAAQARPAPQRSAPQRAAPQRGGGGGGRGR
ncbi:DUF3300 domain-containing protein [Falsiroseomonas bella]|nr:DUF3300 domain-containing protein [Falsiroseomonas bella]